MPPGAVLREAGRLIAPFWPLCLIATVVGLASGVATPWLLATINRALHTPEGMGWPLLAQFAALCLLSQCGTALTGALNSVIGQRLIAALRKDIAARILRAPTAMLEHHRTHGVMAILTSDVETLSVFTFNVSGYAIALAITFGSFAYLAVLSPVACLLALVAAGLGVAATLAAKRRWIADYREVRTAQDDLHKQYRAVIDGAKELKLHRPRRLRVFGRLLSGTADRIADRKSRAMSLYWAAEAADATAFFALIGLLLCARGWLGIDGVALSGAVLVLLYVRAPISLIASAVPMLDQARISLDRIAQLTHDFDQSEVAMPLAEGAKGGEPAPCFDAIALSGASYAFPGRVDGSPFVLGPADFEIRPGELVFLVGANGSGKTTFLKLLLGLYVPQAGHVLWNGIPVTAERRDAYRQLFTTIFSDDFLFDDLAYDMPPDDVAPLLVRLGLEGKVGVIGSRFSTTDLSTGQRKRLALVHAFIEDRPVVVTDEWAADQDPAFRRIFYEELLPDLRARGRTLIVVSHDDRYFHVADRIVTLCDGRVVDDRLMRRPVPAEEGAAP